MRGLSDGGVPSSVEVGTASAYGFQVAPKVLNRCARELGKLPVAMQQVQDSVAGVRSVTPEEAFAHPALADLFRRFCAQTDADAQQVAKDAIGMARTLGALAQSYRRGDAEAAQSFGRHADTVDDDAPIPALIEFPTHHTPTLVAPTDDDGYPQTQGEVDSWWKQDDRVVRIRTAWVAASPSEQGRGHAAVLAERPGARLVSKLGLPMNLESAAARLEETEKLWTDAADLVQQVLEWMLTHWGEGIASAAARERVDAGRIWLRGQADRTQNMRGLLTDTARWLRQAREYEITRAADPFYESGLRFIQEMEQRKAQYLALGGADLNRWRAETITGLTSLARKADTSATQVEKALRKHQDTQVRSRTAALACGPWPGWPDWSPGPGPSVPWERIRRG